jgi:hypothetical protein
MTGFLPIIPPNPLNTQAKGIKKKIKAIKKASAQASSPSASIKRQEEQLAVLKVNLRVATARAALLRDILSKPPIEILFLFILPANRYSIPWLPQEKRLKTPTEAKAILAELVTSIANTSETIRLLETALRSVSRVEVSKAQKQDEQNQQGATNTPPKTRPKKSPVEYNVSAVKEAYFRPNMSLFNQVEEAWAGKGATNKFDSDEIYAKNTPAKVRGAKKLWEEVLAAKGMIQTHEYPGSQQQAYHDGSGTFSDSDGQKSLKRFGFQFHYNPEAVVMRYGGVPAVNPANLSSGKEEFNSLNPSLASSTVEFTLVLNRMFDLKYIGPGGVLNSDESVEKLWPANSPDAKTLKDIYEKGTMYDVEFLLRTMFRIDSFPSQLRGDTTDIGYLGAQQVQLHLGKSLRYVVIIDGITVNHSIFNNKMVPMFSTVNISARRVPDYRGGKVADGA